MKSRILSLLTLVALCLLTCPAFAYPYKLYAKYLTNRTSDTTPTYDTIEIGALDTRAGGASSERTFVPTAPIGATFVGLHIAPKSDDIAKIELDRLDELFVDVYDTSNGTLQIGHERLTRAELISGKEKYVPIALRKGSLSNDVFVHVRLHFEANYLCEQERKLRAESPSVLQIRTPAKAAAPLTLVKGGPTIDLDVTNASILNSHGGSISLLSYATLFERGLKTDRNDPIIYSYCKSVNEDINWDAYAKILSEDTKSPITGKDLHIREKRKLASIINEKLAALGGYGNIHLERYGDDRLENTYGEFKHYASLVRNLKHLSFMEYGAETQALGTIVDKASALIVTVSSDICSEIEDCHGVIGKHFSVEVTFTNDEAKSTSTVAPLTAYGGGWLISSDLEKHIGEKLDLTVYYSLQNGTRLTLLKLPKVSKVENIGLITTFPAVTEVVALINGIDSEPSNASARSTVPLSFAFDTKGGTKGTAITLPWLLGYNPRWAPRLAEQFSIFGHVSAIVPFEGDEATDATPSPRVAVGAGVAIVKAFTFSLGWPVTKLEGERHAFFFVGISAPDLADAFKLGKK